MKPGAFCSRTYSHIRYNRGVQFQVPQFIETEDKIVGPLSLRQFLYVGVGVGLSGMLYFVLQTWLWIFIAFILVGASVAISFVKIEGRPLAKVILSAFNFYWRPQTYVWQPEHPSPQKGKTPKEAPAAPPPAREKFAAATALHKHWENLQTGEKMSAKQFAEKKMNSRYEIFQKLSGERRAARRVDYR